MNEKKKPSSRVRSVPRPAHLDILDEWAACCDELSSVIQRLQEVAEPEPVARLLASYAALFLAENEIGVAAFVEQVRADVGLNSGVTD